MFGNVYGCRVVKFSLRYWVEEIRNKYHSLFRVRSILYAEKVTG